MTSIPVDDVTLLSPEKSAELPSPEPKPLKGFIHYYLSPNHAKLTFHDTSIEPVCIRPGLYGVKKHTNLNWPIPSPNEPEVLILFPRRDSTKKPRKLKRAAVVKSRRYVLILYKPFKTEFQRKQLSRLLERTPLIRIRSGIVLAPQILAGRYQPYQKALLRPSQFIFRLSELGSPTHFASRLELLTSFSEEKLDTLIHQMFDKRVQRLVNACRMLYIECRLPPTERKSIIHYKKRFKRIRKQLHFLRWQSKFFKEELGVDIQRGVVRVASAVHRVYKRLQLCDT
jgi:hypothetical protein